jgi:DNA-binding GntR family transcriptional regulator
MTEDLLITDNIPARDLAHRKLRDAIISGQFKPGQRLLERELVDRMGVSRTPIREALRKLELEGLVTTVPYKGPIVAMPTVEEARQLYEVRASLEGRAVDLFMERTDDATIDRLVKKHSGKELEHLLEQRSPKGILAANNAFHDVITSGCGNPLLQSMIQNMRNRIVLLRVDSLFRHGRHPRAIREHRAIVRMIGRRNKEGAKRLAEQHVMSAWREVHEHMISRASR